jgi:hypothetical protein
VDRLKSLLPREQELPVTRIVRALMEQRAVKGVTEQYLYFDPQVCCFESGFLFVMFLYFHISIFLYFILFE